MELFASFDSQFTALAPFVFYILVGAIVFIVPQKARKAFQHDTR